MQMSASEIAHSYRRNGQSREQINILAELNACSPAAIVEVLKQEGVALPPGSNSHQCRPLPQAPYHIDELRAMELYREGLCDMDMAEQLGCTRSSVANWRKRMHLKAHYPKRQARKPGQTAPPVPPEEETPPDAVVTQEARPSAFPGTDAGDDGVCGQQLTPIDVSMLASILRTMADTAPNTTVFADGSPVVRMEIISGKDLRPMLRLITDRGRRHG